MTLLQRKSVTHFFENVTVFLGILQGGIRWELDFRIIIDISFMGSFFVWLDYAHQPKNRAFRNSLPLILLVAKLLRWTASLLLQSLAQKVDIHVKYDYYITILYTLGGLYDSSTF